MNNFFFIIAQNLCRLFFTAPCKRTSISPSNCLPTETHTSYIVLFLDRPPQERVARVLFCSSLTPPDNLSSYVDKQYKHHVSHSHFLCSFIRKWRLHTLSLLVAPLSATFSRCPLEENPVSESESLPWRQASKPAPRLSPP